ncbi:ATP-grasp domain-containing protein [Croceivirga radicis]|uniref:ATP-grasp domain-containing protein n=1 Tax=Croceivirga radicis TaxID=1929488 RepID=UPI0002FE6A86|nr:ATP-grasp domain-containing protein [Croceivirga radicis]
MRKNCAVVLGGYVNGYSIALELHEKNIENIALVQYGKQLAGYSNLFNTKLSVDKTSGSLLLALQKLIKEFGYLVLFPTDDLFIENLYSIREKIEDFAFLPFNPGNIISATDKAVQYQFCEKLGVPYPKSVELKNINDVPDLANRLRLPIIIKPNKREDLKIKVFRSVTISSENELSTHQESLKTYFEKGVSFLASEIVPGHTNGTIYAYVGYRSPKTKTILNEWIGRKLTQYPDDYGVFSSASNEAPEIIRAHGQALLNGMDLYGICEPEFKYDPRDGDYKLMEINLRSMMWHRVGNLSGVFLQQTQWLDALGKTVPKYEQSTKLVHFSYLKHEVVNLVLRKGYFRLFKQNLYKGDENRLAMFTKGDLKPFIIDQGNTITTLVKQVAKKLLRRIK